MVLTIAFVADTDHGELIHRVWTRLDANSVWYETIDDAVNGLQDEAAQAIIAYLPLRYRSLNVPVLPSGYHKANGIEALAAMRAAGSANEHTPLVIMAPFKTEKALSRLLPQLYGQAHPDVYLPLPVAVSSVCAAVRQVIG